MSDTRSHTLRCALGVLIVLYTGTSVSYSATFNVRDYGAKGDGSADDTVPIQQAIERAAAQGGSVRIPGGTYKIGGTVCIRRPNVSLLGDEVDRPVLWFAPSKDTPDNQYLLDVWDNRGSEGKYNYDNSPSYSDLSYFDPVEYGGNDFRLANISLAHLELRVDRDNRSNWVYPLRLLKVDGFRVTDVKIRFVGTPRCGNACRAVYCSDGHFSGLDIAGNTNSTYGFFCYWSHGVDIVNSSFQEYAGNSVEYKHGVRCNVEGVKIKRRDGKIGLRIGYGSHDITCTRVALDEAILSLGASLEFNFSDRFSLQDVEVKNTLGVACNISRLRDSVFRSVKFSGDKPLVFQGSPRFVASRKEDTLTPNSGYFVYDGQYDQKHEELFLGVKHWRYYEIWPLPTAQNVRFETSTFTVIPGRPASRACIDAVLPGNVPGKSVLGPTGAPKRVVRCGCEGYAASLSHVVLDRCVFRAASNDSGSHAVLRTWDHVLEECELRGATMEGVRQTQASPRWAGEARIIGP